MSAGAAGVVSRLQFAVLVVGAVRWQLLEQLDAFEQLVTVLTCNDDRILDREVLRVAALVTRDPRARFLAMKMPNLKALPPPDVAENDLEIQCRLSMRALLPSLLYSEERGYAPHGSRNTSPLSLVLGGEGLGVRGLDLAHTLPHPNPSPWTGTQTICMSKCTSMPAALGLRMVMTGAGWRDGRAKIRRGPVLSRRNAPSLHPKLASDPRDPLIAEEARIHLTLANLRHRMPAVVFRRGPACHSQGPPPKSRFSERSRLYPFR